MGNNAATGGGVAGAVVAIAIWIFEQIFPQIKIPPEIAAAFTTVASAIGAWFGSRSSRSSRSETATAGN